MAKFTFSKKLAKAYNVAVLRAGAAQRAYWAGFTNPAQCDDAQLKVLLQKRNKAWKEAEDANNALLFDITSRNSVFDEYDRVAVSHAGGWFTISCYDGVLGEEKLEKEIEVPFSIVM